jgi:multidrug efflux pump subunit AcrA (membrane-fusion protein)
MQSFLNFFKNLWRRFSALSTRTKIIYAVVLVAVVVGIVVLVHGKADNTADNALPTVTVQSLDSFGAGADSVDVLGTVQSVSEADLLAQSGGTVESVNTTLGANVPAGFVIASLDSSAASASVLQAQGAYDAAVAAEQAVSLQSQNSTNSVAVEQTAVRNTYESTYSTLDTTLETDVSVFFGAAGPYGPQLVISPLSTGNQVTQEHQKVLALVENWRESLATDSTTDPLTLLSNAQTTLNAVSVFLTDLGALADQSESGSTPAQLASLGAARTAVNGLLANISATQTAYNASVTAAAVGQTQSGTGDSSAPVTSSEASVEEALGGLRAAQAAYEKTVVRAPIAGTVNYLSIHVGDYVTANQHVATVAHDNTLEVVMYLSQSNRNRLAVGDTLNIIGSDASGNPTTYQGVVTTIAPALDPTTQEIEVDVAVNNGAALVDGQSVQVALPTPTPAMVSSESSSSTSDAAGAGATSSTTASIEVPITAVKLLPNERDLFTVDSTGHIVAHPVTIGSVIGNDIQILTPLDPSLEIITDARGLSAGDMVLVASSTPTD